MLCKRFHYIQQMHKLLNADRGPVKIYGVGKQNPYFIHQSKVVHVPEKLIWLPDYMDLLRFILLML